MMGRVDPAELVRQTRMAQGLYNEGRAEEATLNALQKSGSLRAANETEELRKAFEESERKRDEDRLEQAKENRVNRWLTVASLLIAFVSMVAAILALVR
mgnify:CR=1 FL=1